MNSKFVDYELYAEIEDLKALVDARTRELDRYMQLYEKESAKRYELEVKVSQLKEKTSD